MLLDLNGGAIFRNPDYPASNHQVKRTFVVELSRPTDAHLQTQAESQRGWRFKADAVA